MFYRVRNDKSGWEPRRFFAIVEFMLHDLNMSGTIDMDECMEILFRRFGKDQVWLTPADGSGGGERERGYCGGGRGENERASMLARPLLCVLAA